MLFLYLVKDGVQTKIDGNAKIGTANGIAVNNSGQVLGTYQIRPEEHYLFEPQVGGAFIYENGAVRDLNIGLDAQVYAMNDLGQIAGAANFDNKPDPLGNGPALSAFVYINGVITDILPRSEKVGTSRATAINNAGQVIGVWRPPIPSQLVDGGVFLYEDGKLTDIGALPEVREAGWTYTDGPGARLDFWPFTPLINNAGQIIFYARSLYTSGKHGPLLLTPIAGTDLASSKSRHLYRHHAG